LYALSISAVVVADTKHIRRFAMKALSLVKATPWLFAVVTIVLASVLNSLAAVEIRRGMIKRGIVATVLTQFLVLLCLEELTAPMVR
jgi:anaerobic C4-dicarboxylate transporter